MAFVNSYKPPTAPTLADSELYGPTPYDINFSWPLHEETLKTDRLKLVPFVPSVHAETYWANVKDHPELFRFFPRFNSTLAEFLTWVEIMIRRNPSLLLLAMIDTTRLDAEHPDWGGSLAGILLFCNTVAQNLTTEVGYIVVFPEAQHTHVAKEMVALCLRYLLNLPGASPPGIGFRRVQWCAHPGNAPSIGLAERMWFKREGTLRYLWVLPDVLSHMGDKGREGDVYSGRGGRHTAVLSVCWDDWEGGVNEKVEAFLKR
ncbi:acyl-CoA N-acyltransferase [Daedaleopsis nitida]|nr:acyl-CoA N-acyltransferase [Daedaleopsis nitida]